MIIENLEMKNFKSHRDTKIDFDTGITIIMGGNGAGKSSILEAVSFALFKQHSSKKIEQLITLGDVKNKLYIKLDFTSNGRTYRVTRELTGICPTNTKLKLETFQKHSTTVHLAIYTKG